MYSSVTTVILLNICLKLRCYFWVPWYLKIFLRHISKLWEQNYNLPNDTQEEGTTGQGAGSGGIRLILSILTWYFLMTFFKLKICAISDSYKQPGIPDSFLPERGVSDVSSIWGRWHFLHLRGGLGGISYISYIASVPSHFCNKMELNPNWLEHVSSLSLLFIPSCVSQLVCNVLVYDNKYKMIYIGSVSDRLADRHVLS